MNYSEMYNWQLAHGQPHENADAIAKWHVAETAPAPQTPPSPPVDRQARLRRLMSGDPARQASRRRGETPMDSNGEEVPDAASIDAAHSAELIAARQADYNAWAKREADEQAQREACAAEFAKIEPLGQGRFASGDDRARIARALEVERLVLRFSK